MKIYLASGFDYRAHLLKEVVPVLQDAGHTVTSQWVTIGHGINSIGKDDLCDSSQTQRAQKFALEDLNDMLDANLIALFTEGKSTTGGCHIEYGYALGRGMDIAIVGPRLNVFHSIEAWHINHYPTEKDFLDGCKSGAVWPRSILPSL